MIRKFIAACVLILFVSSATAFAADEELKAGDVIRVTGVGSAPSNWNQRDSFAKTFARQAARMDALAKFAEEVGGVYFEIDTLDLDIDKVTAWVNLDDKVFKIIETNARQIGKARFLEDGTCEVDMELILPDDWKK